MAKLVWNEIGKRVGETGVSHGVIYPFSKGKYGDGVAWNGLTSVNEAPTGAEANPFYADNTKYIELMSAEEYAGSIGCYTYPDEFKECIGEVELSKGVHVGQQTHKPFGFSYQTKIVNDTDGIDHGFKVHLVYGALAGTSSRDHTTINESPELEEISFDFTTTKVAMKDGRMTSHLIIDSTKVPQEKKAKLEELLDILYGKDAHSSGTPAEKKPKLPTPDEVKELFA